MRFRRRGRRGDNVRRRRRGGIARRDTRARRNRGSDGEGAQVFQCVADAAGALAWTFREPIATLLRDGKTVGQHFAGPRWRLADGGEIRGEVTAKAPGASPSDIPWLKLAIASHEGRGALDEVTTIQRINTVGGVAAGACEAAGTFRSVAYSADYVFLRK